MYGGERMLRGDLNGARVGKMRIFGIVFGVSCYSGVIFGVKYDIMEVSGADLV